MAAMIARFLPADAPLTDRFRHLLYWMLEGVSLDWRRRGLRHVHSAEIWQRLLGLGKRFRSVVARWEAGTLTAPRGRVARSAEGRAPAPDPQGGRELNGATGWRSVLPRRFGWLKTLVLPENVGWITSFNCLLQDDADLKAIMAAAPQQIGRVLRPFCHFLGLEVPAELRLPKRRRVRRSDPPPRPSPSRGEGEDTSLRPSPHSGEGEEGTPTPALSRGAGLGREADQRANGADSARRRRRTPREIAEALMAWSERTGKAIDIGKVSSVVWGYIVHTPRDGNCPPVEIGYGGRRWRPPKDYKPPNDWE
jgi:hypothetical protein